MRRDTLNFLVDTLALLAIVGLLATGLILWTALPPGSRGGHGLSLWGLTRHELGDVHFWIAVTLLALMILHVVLHWTWVCVTVQRWFRPAGDGARVPTSRRRNLWGLAFLVALGGAVGGFYWVASNSVINEDAGERRNDDRDAARSARPEPHEAGRSDLHLSGGMTLGEAAAVAGVDAAALCEELGLPATVSPDEQLGRLRQRFGVDMATLRRIVAELADGTSFTDTAPGP